MQFTAAGQTKKAVIAAFRIHAYPHEFICIMVETTLTPALCAVLMKPREKKGSGGFLMGFFVKFNLWFDRMQEKYANILEVLVRRLRPAVIFLCVICGLVVVLFRVLPSTFVPDEDQGYFLTSLSLPEGASLNRVEKSMAKLAESMENIPGVRNVMLIGGYDMLSAGIKSNAGTAFIGLEDWADRKTVETSVGRLTRTAMGIGMKEVPEATVIAFTTPSLPGLGMVGGWSMELQDLFGHSDAELTEIAQAIVAAASKRPELQGTRTTHRSNSPIYEFEIDRDKVSDLGVDISTVFTTMQVSFGGYQVNDFNEFGRTYKVMLQADSAYRNQVEGIRFMYVKNADGSMVPLDTLLKPRRGTATSVISRFNGARSITFQGSVGSGYSSGQAMAAMEEIVREVAPSGFNVEWSGQSREEKKSSGSAVHVMAISLLFVFLCLAALYESWSIPFAVLLTVPAGVFGALLSEYGLGILSSLTGHSNPGLLNSIYMQISIIMVIGLAAKNAILIVEFAKVQAEQGMNAMDAAVYAAKLRLRPIMMTALTSIIGCLPLAIASGAGAAARNGMGVAVVGGMVFATTLGIFLIPVFFVLVENLAAKWKNRQNS